MSLPIRTISPLRQRMVDDVALRKLSDKPLLACIRAVHGFAPPSRLGNHRESAMLSAALCKAGVSPVSIGPTLTGLKLSFEVTAERAGAIAKMSPVRPPQFPGGIESQRSHPVARVRRQREVSRRVVGGPQCRGWCAREVVGLRIGSRQRARRRMRGLNERRCKLTKV